MSVFPTTSFVVCRSIFKDLCSFYDLSEIFFDENFLFENSKIFLEKPFQMGNNSSIAKDINKFTYIMKLQLNTKS